MHKIYSLLSKKAQAYVETMELKEVLNILFFMNNENFTRRDKEKLIAVHETILEYNTKEDIKEIRSPKEAYDFLKPKFIGNEQEEFHAIFLNTKNRIIHTEMVFKGSINTCIVDPKCLYSRALKCSASAVIVAHSHPSGDPTPSNEDIEVTKRLKEVGEIVGVVFLDHIILGDNSHISLKETHFF